MTSERVREFFKNSAGYLAVALISCMYIVSGFLKIEATGRSVGEIIANGAISFLLGLSINRVFDMQGMMNGDRDERVRATLALHGETVLAISPFIGLLDAWCLAKNAEVLKSARIGILARGGLRYEDCFDEDGVALPYKCGTAQGAAERHRRRAYRRAVGLHLSELSAASLTGDGGRTSDPLYLGRTKAQYAKGTLARDVVSKLLIAVIFGYWGARLVEELSYASLVWTGLQTALFIILGVVKMYSSYFFVTEEYRARLVRKIDNLQKFQNDMKNKEEQHGETHGREPHGDTHGREHQT